MNWSGVNSPRTPVIYPKSISIVTQYPEGGVQLSTLKNTAGAALLISIDHCGLQAQLRLISMRLNYLSLMTQIQMIQKRVFNERAS
jgi:hypothetical protein